MNLLDLFLLNEETPKEWIEPSYLKDVEEKKGIIVNKTVFINLIKSLNYDETKGITVMTFKDGTVIKKKTSEGDSFDLNVGVALCIVEYLFDTSSQFHKKVQVLKKEYDAKKQFKLKQKEHKKELNKSNKKKKSITKKGE